MWFFFLSETSCFEKPIYVYVYVQEIVCMCVCVNKTKPLTAT